jgi:hypothetical protein
MQEYLINLFINLHKVYLVSRISLPTGDKVYQI